MLPPLGDLLLLLLLLLLVLLVLLLLQDLRVQTQQISSLKTDREQQRQLQHCGSKQTKRMLGGVQVYVQLMKKTKSKEISKSQSSSSSSSHHHQQQH